ncbi:MAG: ATP-binding protein [Candidatus Paceibacterota bacterium]|jgi:signal transduction histidine kinase
MLDIYQSAVIITAFFFTGFGGFAIWKNQKDVQARRFALLSFAFAAWSYSWFFLLKTTSNADSALILARILNLGATFIPVLFLHWVFVATEYEKKNKMFMYLCYLITLFFAAFSFTDLYVTGVRAISIFAYWPIAGPFYIYFIFIGYIGFILTGLIMLIKKFFSTSGIIHYRTGYLFVGSMLGFIGGSVNFPMMFGIVIPQPYDLIGIFMLMMSPIIFSYAALQYQLFDIRNVAVQLFAGALNIVFIINLLLAKTFSQIFINALLLVFTLSFTVLLLRTLKKETLQRERIELLAADLEKANVRLIDLDRQKSEFISFATHQLRAPLTAMKGYASLLLEGDMGPLPESAKQGVSRIFDSTNTLVSIVNDYLNISRIELGAMKYAFETIDLRMLVEDTIAELKPNLEKTKLKFTFDHKDDGTDYRMTADRDKLKQVLANVIDNSIKYTPQGSVTVTLTLDRSKHRFVLKVKDTGVGIASDVMPRLFQKFSRAENANKTNIRGSGLGLYVAKQMIEAHHGTIRAESEGEGKGSTFIVEFEPLAKA